MQPIDLRSGQEAQAQHVVVVPLGDVDPCTPCALPCTQRTREITEAVGGGGGGDVVIVFLSFWAGLLAARSCSSHVASMLHWLLRNGGMAAQGRMAARLTGPSDFRQPHQPQ